jgi:hypothetical protein
MRFHGIVQMLYFRRPDAVFVQSGCGIACFSETPQDKKKQLGNGIACSLKSN